RAALAAELEHAVDVDARVHLLPALATGRPDPQTVPIRVVDLCSRSGGRVDEPEPEAAGFAQHDLEVLLAGYDAALLCAPNVSGVTRAEVVPRAGGRAQLEAPVGAGDRVIRASRVSVRGRRIDVHPFHRRAAHVEHSASDRAELGGELEVVHEHLRV